MSSEPILKGMRVVELSAFVAAPLSGVTLCELGAEVVRVEPPGGGIDIDRWPLHGARSLYRTGLDQGKRSVTIDMNTERGQDLVTDLIAHAGVFLTNMPQRPWCTYERLMTRRPDLIMAVITGDPAGGTAVDYTVNAAVGFPWITGPEGWDGPVNHVLPAWDLLAGYLSATAIVAAELHRTKTGEGQLVNVSLMNVALSVAGHLGFIAEAQLNEEPRGRFGNFIYGSYSRDFKTSDGRHVLVVALTARQWTSLVEAIGIRDEISKMERTRGVDLREEGPRFGARREISELIEPWVAARPYAEVARVFNSKGVLWSPYQNFKELVQNDPRCSAANPLFSEIESPGLGRTLRAGSPISFGRSGRNQVQASGALGTDTANVLSSWLGLSEAQVTSLAADGVVAVGAPA